MNKIIKIAIIGLGQVGNYLYREINLKKKSIELKTGKKIQIIAISAKNKNDEGMGRGCSRNDKCS